jgi:hypothetical protein
MRRKYQLRPASIIQIRIFEVLSQYLLTVTKLSMVSTRKRAPQDLDHLPLANRRVHVRRDEDAKDSNVNARYGKCGAPFQLLDCPLGLSDNADSVDDDLHQQLDLKYPKEQNEKENGDTVVVRLTSP